MTDFFTYRKDDPETELSSETLAFGGRKEGVLVLSSPRLRETVVGLVKRVGMDSPNPGWCDIILIFFDRNCVLSSG